MKNKTYSEHMIKTSFVSLYYKTNKCTFYEYYSTQYLQFQGIYHLVELLNQQLPFYKKVDEFYQIFVTVIELALFKDRERERERL